MNIREHGRLYNGLDSEKSLIVLSSQEKAAFYWATDTEKLYSWSGSAWVEIVGSGSGEVNTASNVGVGTGEVFKEKVGDDLRLRTLLQGTNVTITTGTDEVTINASGEANTASNVGTGEGSIFRDKSGVDLRLKTIKAGSNITVTNNADDITIASSGGGETDIIQVQVFS